MATMAHSVECDNSIQVAYEVSHTPFSRWNYDITNSKQPLVRTCFGIPNPIWIYLRNWITDASQADGSTTRRNRPKDLRLPRLGARPDHQLKAATLQPRTPRLQCRIKSAPLVRIGEVMLCQTSAGFRVQISGRKKKNSKSLAKVKE